MSLTPIERVNSTPECLVKSKEGLVIIENMRRYLARRNASIIWGNGFKLNTKEDKLEKFFNKYNRINRLEETFYFIEELLSLYGGAIVSINKTADGNFYINICDPLFANQIGKTFYQEQLAVVWQYIIQDNFHWLIKSTYDTKKCVNDLYTYEENTWKKVSVFDTTIELPNGMVLEREWYHNLGAVPVVEFNNYPNKFHQMMSFNSIQQADWYNARSFEPLFYTAYKNFKTELALNHSRIGIENANQQIVQNIEGQFGLDKEAKDIIGGYIIDTPTGSKLSVINGVGDFASYSNAMDSIMDFYCKFANASRFSEGGGAQKTSQETKNVRSAQIEGINTKIQLREKKITELLAKLFGCGGLVDYQTDSLPFTFKINGNIQKEDTTFLDNIIKQVSLGTMTIEEAIADLRHIPIQNAKEIFKYIKKFNEENDIVISNSGVEEENFEENNEGGRPPEVNE